MRKDGCPEDIFALVLKDDSYRVAESFFQFMLSFEAYKKKYKLNGCTDSFEICTSLVDKIGRISRNIKHFKRNDPKENWETETVESIFGTISYLLMLVKNHNLYVKDSIIKELIKSVEQHSIQ